MFSACPSEQTIPCVSPGFYSVIGAAAMLGGVTRMTSRPFRSEATSLYAHQYSSLPSGDHVRVDRRVVSCFAHYGFSYDGEMGRGSVWEGGYLSTVDSVKELPMDPAARVQGQG